MNNRIAKVVVDVAVDQEFDYLVPAEMVDSLQIGSRVHVPLGKTFTGGYVVGFAGESRFSKLKEIQSIVGCKPFIDNHMLDLSKWIARYYCVSVEQAIRVALPGSVRRRGAKFRQQMFVSLTHSESAASGHQPVIKGQHDNLSEKQLKVLKILGESSGGMFLSDIRKDVGITDAPVRSLEKKGFVQISPAPVRRDPFADLTILRSQPLELMPEQAEALKRVKECITEIETRNHNSGAGIRENDKLLAEHGRRDDNICAVPPHVILLYGVTGSGKTEVYLQAIDHVLKDGKGAIVLVPEISLTPQTVERFVSRFGERIAVLHSHLSDGERHDEWHRINDGKADIVVGARSAVFAPVANLGLIVVDEEHEPSYKQEDTPRYNARDVAVVRGKIEGCAVILGSATPSMESWHNAAKGKYRLSKLTVRADNRKMPFVRVVDMRVEAERSGHVSIFSKELMEAVRLRLERSEQIILFLNRRGYASSIICPKCGYVAECGNCSVSFTYHRNSEELRCHICGARKQVPAKCPGCHDPAFKYAGVGTQRIESILAKFFPKARIQRMDADITTSKDSYDRILGDFRAGRTDILVGTQMIAKGLHFPNVTLVGVILADLSLHIPDIRAGERTFQLLAQVAGRSGRGEISGEVIIQTYTPSHSAIQFARSEDFERFASEEINGRKELHYPPFSHLVCLCFKGRSENRVEFSALTLLNRLKSRISASVTVSGVAPAPLARAKGYFRYQIMLRASSTNLITGPLMGVLKEFKMPDGVSCSTDIDAINLM